MYYYCTMRILHYVYTTKSYRVLILSCEHECLMLIRHKFKTMFVAISKTTTLLYFFLNKKMTKIIIYQSIKFWQSGSY